MKYFSVLAFLVLFIVFFSHKKHMAQLASEDSNIEVAVSNHVSDSSNRAHGRVGTTIVGQPIAKASLPNLVTSSYNPKESDHLKSTLLLEPVGPANPRQEAEKSKLEKLEIRESTSKFTWQKMPINKQQIEKAILDTGSKTSEQIKEILNRLPESANVLLAAPGEVRLSYNAVHVLSCPNVPKLKYPMVVRFDTAGNPIDVEWLNNNQVTDPVPDFVYACRFSPALVDGVATTAVFVWPTDPIQLALSQLPPRNPAGN